MPQAPTHFLVIPKKLIPMLEKAEDADEQVNLVFVHCGSCADDGKRLFKQIFDISLRPSASASCWVINAYYSTLYSSRDYYPELC